MEEPGRLQSMESQRVEQDQATSLSLSLDLEYKMRHANANSFFKRTCLSKKTTYPNNPRDDSTHSNYQMVSTKVRLIMFFAAKDGEVLYNQ